MVIRFLFKDKINLQIAVISKNPNRLAYFSVLNLHSFLRKQKSNFLRIILSGFFSSDE